MAITYRILLIGSGFWKSKTVKDFSKATAIIEDWKKDPRMEKIGLIRKEHGSSEIIAEFSK